MKKYYYLINGKLYLANSEMPKGYIDCEVDQSNWRSSLQPCEITEGELEKLNLHLFYNDKDKGFFRDSPINVTDLVNDENGVVRFREMNKNLDSDTWFINNLIGLAHAELALLKENKIESVDRVKLSNWINKHIKHPKQVDEASEAVEFAEWLYKGYMMYGDKTHKWTDTINTFTTQELYEIFKSK